jgi:hypothetical protein
MPAVPEELDVFRLAHGHMKQLVKDMDKEVLKTTIDIVYLYVHGVHACSSYHHKCDTLEILVVTNSEI